MKLYDALRCDSYACSMVWPCTDQDARVRAHLEGWRRVPRQTGRWLDYCPAHAVAAGVTLPVEHECRDGSRVPVLSAWVDGGIAQTWCPPCHRWHYHGHGGPLEPLGAGDGHRVAHCSQGMPLERLGYVVRERGYWTQRPSRLPGLRVPSYLQAIYQAVAAQRALPVTLPSYALCDTAAA